MTPSDPLLSPRPGLRAAFARFRERVLTFIFGDQQQQAQDAERAFVEAQRIRFIESVSCEGSSKTLTALGIVLTTIGEKPEAVCPVCNKFTRVKHNMLVRHGFTRTRL